MLRFDGSPPLSLYIHFPWCERKCPYCDFNSHTAPEDFPEQAYIDALLRDIEQELPGVWGRSVQTVFMGGGTPSLFSAAAIGRLLSGIRARLPLQPGAEITLEANPGSVEQERFCAYREIGVNRLSIGIQSLDDERLQSLGRIHSAGQAIAAVATARAAGFDNFNLDLMFALPQQRSEDALRDLGAVIVLQPPHLSWYQLTVEPNTCFHARPPILPDEDEKWDMQVRGQALLAQQGYTQYEVSAFARPEHSCRHNLNYWKFGDYLGIGAGAHGKLTQAGDGRIRRTWKKRHPREYMRLAGSAGVIDGERELNEAEILFEFALNRFRLKAPFELKEFESACGLARSRILPLLQRLQDEELLAMEDERVQTTDRGWLFLNELLERFLPEEATDARSCVD